MPSDLIHTAPSLKSIEVVVSTASRLPRLQAASKSKLLALISLAMLLTASTACENWRCWMSCSVRDTSTKRRMRGLSVFSWRSSSRAKSAMQRSMPLRSLSAKYAKVSSTSDWQSNSLESSPSIAARDKTRVAVARSPM